MSTEELLVWGPPMIHFKLNAFIEITKNCMKIPNRFENLIQIHYVFFLLKFGVCVLCEKTSLPIFKREPLLCRHNILLFYFFCRTGYSVDINVIYYNIIIYYCFGTHFQRSSCEHCTKTTTTISIIIPYNYISKQHFFLFHL